MRLRERTGIREYVGVGTAIFGYGNYVPKY